MDSQLESSPMRSVAMIEIDCPIDDVFCLTCDHLTDWSIIVVEDKVIDPKPDGVGTTFRTVSEDRGRRMEFRGVVTKYEPPCLTTIQLTGRSFDIQTEYHFEEFNGRTRITQTTDVKGKVLFKLFMAVFGWMMNKSHCKASENELESLRRFCEGYLVPQTT